MFGGRLKTSQPVFRRPFLLLIADFGVDQGVEDVEYGVEDDGQYADEDGQPQDHAVVAVERAVDEELSDAGQSEDAFDDDGAGDDADEGRNEIGEDGQHGGTQGVAQDDAVHGQPFGAGSADVGAVQHFYHRAARDAGEACDIADGEGGDGQDEAGQRAVIPAAGGQPFEGDGEDENHDGGFDEAGDDDAGHGGGHDGVVRPCVAPERGDGAHEYAQNGGDDEGVHAQLDGNGQGLGEQLVDVVVFVFERRAEVAVGELFEVIEVLQVHRVVQVVFGFDVGQYGGRYVFVAGKGAAGCEPHHEE